MAFIQSLLDGLSSSSATLAFLGLLFSFLGVRRLYFHPLSHIPSPPFAGITSLFLYIICFLGIECRVVDYYHRKYKASVLRVAPNSLSISDASALHTIYVAGGGFRKDTRYKNFDLHGHATIFSSIDTEYRDRRAKAVLPLFAMARVRGACGKNGILRKCVDEFLEHFQKAKAQAKTTGSKVDILDLSAMMSIDVVTGYLFSKRYGGLDEASTNITTPGKSSPHAGKLSATPFVLAVVAFGRFSLLPNWAFRIVDNAYTRFSSSPELFESFSRLNTFADSLVNTADPEKCDTYQARLLAAGISKVETAAQCKAVTFAGTDSTSVKLATILFHLVQNPQVVERLKGETAALAQDPATDPQTQPYLRAVIKEGLRLGMANPARFTRVVPPEGLRVSGTFIPPGTIVGMAPYTLHHDPEVFPEPFKFKPERWLEEGKEQAVARENSLIPFGVGLRMCLAKNLAYHQLFITVKAVVESGVLEGSRTCKKSIEVVEWFNAELPGHELEIEYPSA